MVQYLTHEQMACKRVGRMSLLARLSIPLIKHGQERTAGVIAVGETYPLALAFSRRGNNSDVSLENPSSKIAANPVVEFRIQFAEKTG